MLIQNRLLVVHSFALLVYLNLCITKGTLDLVYKVRNFVSKHITHTHTLNLHTHTYTRNPAYSRNSSLDDLVGSLFAFVRIFGHHSLLLVLLLGLVFRWLVRFRSFGSVGRVSRGNSEFEPFVVVCTSWLSVISGISPRGTHTATNSNWSHPISGPVHSKIKFSRSTIDWNVVQSNCVTVLSDSINLG